MNGPGDGNASVDWQVLGPNAVRLRAERSGLGDERRYTAGVTCADGFGNVASSSATVTIPKFDCATMDRSPGMLPRRCHDPIRLEASGGAAGVRASAPRRGV